MDEASSAQAVREMVRVTQTAEDSSDALKGVILAGPIFKNGQKELIAGLMADFADKEALPTLIIKKTAALTPEKLEGLIALM